MGSAALVALGIGAVIGTTRHRPSGLGPSAERLKDPETLPYGEARVSVSDEDGRLPIIARVTAQSVDRTEKATLVDVRGDHTLRLPPGRYRISASKGLEWTVDTELVDVTINHLASVELRPRHVIRSDGLVASDLHVHTQPGVSADARLLSLASAGIQFAMTTEQDGTSDYAAAASRADLSSVIALVTGIEVVTREPGIGSFGAFPRPDGAWGLPHLHTDAASFFAAARRGDSSRFVVVHRPRAPSGAGYFQIVGFDSKSHRIPAEMSTDFDMIEVYNGHDLADRTQAETVMADWFALLELGRRYLATGGSDAFDLGYPWAGYPRTYVDVSGELGGWRQGYSGAPLDTGIVLDSIRRGRSFVTSGPIVDFEINGAKPGGELTSRGTLTAHLRVRAAPWVDVTSIEVMAGQTTIYRAALDPRPSTTGKEPGSLDEVLHRAVRFDADVALVIPPTARWIVAIVRGERTYDDALPGMAVQPLAFTNPIWLGR